MPFYEYQATDNNAACEECITGFTRLQKLADAPVIACPQCGNRVRKVISAPNVQMGHAHMEKKANLEKHGFTQYKKVGSGQYEKTAGKGPKNISA